MPRPKKHDALDALKRQHAEQAKEIARLEKEQKMQDAVDAKRRYELIGAAVVKHLDADKLAALLDDVVLPNIKKMADRELIAALLANASMTVAEKKTAKVEPAKAPAAAE